MSPVVLLLLLAGKEPARAAIPAGEWRPFFADAAPGVDAGAVAARPVAVPAFELDVRPVTRAEFLEFVRANAPWRRSRTPRVFAEGGYLRAWGGDLEVDNLKAPVTEVSWFAAKAYCKWRGASLPTVAQWERAAFDPAAGPKILEWYARPSGAPLREAGSGPPNRFGVRDLHGLIWEWVLDFNQNLVADEGRGGDPGQGAPFCGSGGARALDPNDYATFMRYAFRDSLRANYVHRELGFRCARSP